MIRKQKEVAQMIVGFVGAGNMAGAIIRGMAAGGFRGENIWVYDPDEEKLSALYADCGVTICPSAESVASGVDTLVLAVKPQVLPSVLPALTGVLHRCRPLVVSIAAGKDLAALEAMAGEDLAIVRVMPNINAKVNESMSAFCGNAAVTDGHKASVRRIFEAVGEVIELEEKFFSAFSVIAGCSPAYTLLYIDALAQAGVKYGLSKALALKIASQAVLGTTRLLQETGEHPRALADQVCSPAGTTIAGVCSLQDHAFEAAVIAAADASLERDRQL